jgi:hypothetical protein
MMDANRAEMELESTKLRSQLNAFQVGISKKQFHIYSYFVVLVRNRKYSIEGSKINR